MVCSFCIVKCWFHFSVVSFFSQYIQIWNFFNVLLYSHFLRYVHFVKQNADSMSQQSGCFSNTFQSEISTLYCSTDIFYGWLIFYSKMLIQFLKRQHLFSIHFNLKFPQCTALQSFSMVCSFSIVECWYNFSKFSFFSNTFQYEISTVYCAIVIFYSMFIFYSKMLIQFLTSQLCFSICFNLKFVQCRNLQSLSMVHPFFIVECWYDFSEVSSVISQKPDLQWLSTVCCVKNWNLRNINQRRSCSLWSANYEHCWPYYWGIC